MVHKLLRFIGKEVGGLHEAAYLLGFFTLLSQILALLRDRLLAASFGASGTLDTYYAAFRIPDFIFISVGSMVSVSVLIPFLMERMKSGTEDGRRFISNIFSFFFLIIVLASITAFFLTPYLSSVLFPGFSSASLDQVVVLTRILLLSPIFLGISNLLGTLTQAYKRFFIYALSPILYNLGIIAGVVFLYPVFGPVGLAYGVIAGAFLHFAIQIPFIIECGMFPRFTFRYKFKEIRQVLVVSLPRTFTLGADSLSMIFLLSIASIMASGSIAIFTFSYNLQSVPLSVIGVSYSLAAFPILVKLFGNGNKDEFIDRIVVSARHIIFWTIPIATLFIVLRAQIVRTILGSGEFDWVATRLTAAALAVFSISLVFQSLTLLFVRAYYATGSTAKPFIAKALNALTTVALGYVFMIMFERFPPFRNFLETILRVKDVPGSVMLALPLAWSVGEFLNTVALWVVFQKDFKGFSQRVARTAGETLAASAAMGVVAYFLLDLFDNIFDINTFFGIFFQGFAAGTIGILVGVILLLIFKNKELGDIVSTLKKRIWKVEIIPSDSMPQ